MQSGDSSVPSGHYMRANGIDIYYETYGSGTPLVLIHGGTLNLSSWSPQIIAFSQHFRVIAFDSRGHGRTVNAADTLSYRLLADDTAAFIQVLALDRPFVCGYSDGGQIALELGIHYPTLVRGYVVGAATHRWSTIYDAKLKEAGYEGRGQVDLARIERDRPGFVARLQEQHDRFQGHAYWKTYLRHLSMMWLAPLSYTAAELQQIHAPTLIIAGDRDEVALPVELAVELYRLLPQAELAILPGSNHGLPWGNAELFNQIVGAYLLRYEAAPTV